MIVRHTKDNTTYEEWLEKWIKHFGVIESMQARHWYNIGLSSEELIESASRKKDKEALTSQCQKRWY